MQCFNHACIYESFGLSASGRRSARTFACCAGASCVRWFLCAEAGSIITDAMFIVFIASILIHSHMPCFVGTHCLWCKCVLCAIALCQYNVRHVCAQYLTYNIIKRWPGAGAALGGGCGGDGRGRASAATPRGGSCGCARAVGRAVTRMCLDWERSGRFAYALGLLAALLACMPPGWWPRNMNAK